jgi:hydrogenase maturation protease
MALPCASCACRKIAAALDRWERSGEVEVVLAGRAGIGLLALFERVRSAVLVDVTSGAGRPGTITSRSIDEVVRTTCADRAQAVHGLGVGDALRLAVALGRRLPDGLVVGIEGRDFGIGPGLSPPVTRGLPAFGAELLDAILSTVRSWRAGLP